LSGSRSGSKLVVAMQSAEQESGFRDRHVFGRIATAKWQIAESRVKAELGSMVISDHVHVVLTLIVDRPGVSDRGVTAPVAGVITKIFAYPGETVRSGDRLFGLKLIDYLAQSGAASLDRIVRAQNSGGGLPPGAHFHADGSLHIPGQ
jgi:multidrug efflux pump subunit AcrA (membrane-fusion protein)